LKGIFGLGVDYGDAFLIFILVNQVFSTHSLEHPWIYICLHTITRHKDSSSVHVSKSLDSTIGKSGGPLHAQSIVLLFVNLK
jgi:hypothetical protein